KDKRPERKQTDESLAVERAKTDHALGEKKAAIELKADDIVERAREEADDVLEAARAKADEKLKSPASPEERLSVIAHQRAHEDKLLVDEREKADEILRHERAASARVLARLLPLEREKTDQYLLTERARSDDALANRDDFLGMVSHDLRDLLNAIVGNAAFIVANTAKDTQGEASLKGAQRIQRSAARMGRLIGDLVDIASIDAGKLAIEPTVANAEGVLLEAIETWEGPAASKGITLESSALGPAMAKFDNERILQVLGNLITNAVKFSAAGGTILIGVAKAGGEVIFSVKDSGVGIPANKLDAIFERFWQVGKNDQRGLGLGLYISKCLVQAHGGKIWAESELGAGSTLFFTVPAA
ncbi:MAG: ATP-binding protein, partial [Polyangiaceae bacterium]